MINSTKEKLSDNKNKKTTILMVGMIFVVLGVSIGSTQISSQMVAYAQEEVNDSKSETMKIMSSSIPQPNSNSTILD
ncbi:MAG TPA: hypothetical protein VIY98_03750, partial [Nitrososphaeraceae archaeon]